jgi:Yip1-like protein
MSSTPSPSPPSVAVVERPHRPLIARAFALISSPRSVFEEFLDRPSWFWTTIVTCVIAAIIGFIMWNSVIAPYAIEQAQAKGATGEQLARIEQMYSSPGFRVVGSCGAAVVNFVLIVAIGLGLFALTSFLMGGKATARQALAVAAHAMLVHIPKAIIVVPLAIARQDPTITLGPGALMPVSDATGFLGKGTAIFLSYFDLFNLWSLALCILGMSVVSRLPAKQVAGVIVGGFLACAILFSLLGAIFQGGH